MMTDPAWATYPACKALGYALLRWYDDLHVAVGVLLLSAALWLVMTALVKPFNIPKR